MKELLETFRVEAAEVFDKLAGTTAGLAGLQGEKLRSAAQTSLRLAHNLKGSSGAVGLTTLSRLAHRLEDALVPICRVETHPSSDVVELIQAAVVAAQRLGEFEDSPEFLLEVESIEQRLLEIGEQRTASDWASTPSAPEVESGEVGSSAVEVGSSGPAAESRPSGGGERKLESKDPIELRQRSAEALSNYIRVPTERLDALAGHLDELLAVHGQFGLQQRELHELVWEAENNEEDVDVGVLRRLVQSQRRSQSILSRLLSDLISTFQRVQTVPLATVAPQWRRVVRECAQSLHKGVELVVQVGDTELDKRVLEQLRDPVVHVLRNAVDHGIEPREERILLGKPEFGTITLVAQMVGASVRLEITDDGCGLEPDEVAAAAVRRGLLNADQVARLGPKEKLDLLFLDGFSTAETISTISGRGVGLAAVREDIAQLGGRYGVTSAGYGLGSSFWLQVPISVLATRGLLVRIDDVVYMLPIDTVERALRTTGSQIQAIDGAPVLPCADSNPIPLTWLNGEARVRGNEPVDIVVLSFGVEQLGLVVNEVLDEQECVTRRLPWNLQRVSGVNGVVVLPDGSVAVALDVQHLLDAVRFRGAPVVKRPAARRQRTILVVDDSLTSRTLARNILSSAGYQVDVAVDGQEAWGLLTDREYDLLVTDVEMPQMDGLELTRRVRADSQLRHLPVLLVTSRGRQSDIEQGAAAGADEYLVKGQFDHEKLLQAAERHLFTQ